MLKFRIESLSIVLGILFVLGAAGKQFWEQVVYATDCTSVPGTNTYACMGTNTYFICDCNYAIAGTTYLNPITKDSIPGSGNTNSTTVNCIEIRACKWTIVPASECAPIAGCVPLYFSVFECDDNVVDAPFITTTSTVYSIPCSEG